MYLEYIKNSAESVFNTSIEFIKEQLPENIAFAIVGSAVIGAVFYAAVNKIRSSMAITKIFNSQTIHRPQFPKNSVINDLSQAKVGGFTPYCVCEVFNKLSNTWESALITYRNSDGIHSFVMTSSTGESLGFANVMHYHQMADGFGSPALVFQDDEMAKYGVEPDLVEKIEINDLKNKKRNEYSYVGYNLMKAAMQRFSAVDCRVDMSAAWDSQAFYWKLGFRSTSTSTNRDIANWVYAGLTGRDYGIYKMYLPDWARQAWKDELRDNPLPLAT